MLHNELFKLKDEEYKSFHSGLIPDIPPERIIGIRTPALRKFAKEYAKIADAEGFLNSLPHTYYEENNLHAFIIEEIKDIDIALYETEKLLPYIDNWATCDMFFPKVFKKHPEIMLEKAYEWISSDKTYTVRYGIGTLMKMFLGDSFKAEYIKKVAAVKSDEYYINMMIAWYFATALTKQYDTAVKFIESKALDKWVHNKAIQKAKESLRISQERKLYLNSLKIK